LFGTTKRSKQQKTVDFLFSNKRHFHRANRGSTGKKLKLTSPQRGKNPNPNLPVHLIRLGKSGRGKTGGGAGGGTHSKHQRHKSGIFDPGREKKKRKGESQKHRRGGGDKGRRGAKKMGICSGSGNGGKTGKEARVPRFWSEEGRISKKRLRTGQNGRGNIRLTFIWKGPAQ